MGSTASGISTGSFYGVMTNLMLIFADIDECKSDDHGCEQVCFNTHGSYECMCREGFTLAENEYTCDKAQEVLRAVKQTNNDKVPPFVVFHNK